MYVCVRVACLPTVSETNPKFSKGKTEYEDSATQSCFIFLKTKMFCTFDKHKSYFI